MQYDGLVIAAVVEELNSILVGGRINKVRQHDLTDLTLVIHNHKTDFRLFFSVDAQFPRIYLTVSSHPVPDRPPRFGALLRKYIQGAFIRSIEQIDFDRIIHIDIEAPDGNRTKLVLEIMGKHSNLMLVSDPGKILGAAKHITTAVSRYRQVLPGLDYMPPPPTEKANPLLTTQQEFDRLWDQSFADVEPNQTAVSKFIVSSFSGFGPFLADEIVMRAENQNKTAIWQSFSKFVETVRTGDYKPVLITRESGAIEMVYPIQSVQFPPNRQHRRTSICELLDTLFRQDIKHTELESERGRLEVSLKRAAGSREMTVKTLNKAIHEGSEAEKYKNIGNLILANLGAILKGQEIASVIDYYDPEAPEIEITLDPLLSPKDNAERYFRKFQKVRDGAQAAKDRISDIEREISLLKKTLEDISSITDVERLKDLRKSLVERGLLREEISAPEGRKQELEFGGKRIRKTTSSEGWEILYGENSESNDYLTTKVAASDDIWLHARAVTGAHVIIRTNKRPQAVPPGTLRYAAEIAAANSAAKHSSLVPVDYTLRKYVRKPRGSAPGFVTYRGEHTLDVSYPDPARAPYQSR